MHMLTTYMHVLWMYPDFYFLVLPLCDLTVTNLQGFMEVPYGHISNNYQTLSFLRHCILVRLEEMVNNLLFLCCQSWPAGDYDLADQTHPRQSTSTRRIKQITTAVSHT